MRIFVATLTNVNLAERGMDDDDSEIELVVPAETEDIDSVALGKTIWNEITAGVGIWGAFKPIVAVLLSFVPFMYKITGLFFISSIICSFNSIFIIYPIVGRFLHL